MEVVRGAKFSLNFLISFASKKLENQYEGGHERGMKGVLLENVEFWIWIWIWIWIIYTPIKQEHLHRTRVYDLTFQLFA